MAGDCGTYVLAVPRALRGLAPAGWQERLRELPGVCAGGAASPDRLQIEADDLAIARIREEFGGFLTIEPLALRQT